MIRFLYYLLRNKLLAKLGICSPADLVVGHPSWLMSFWFGDCGLRGWIYVCNPGGTVDARGFEGAQTFTTNPFDSVTKPVQLWLGAATFTTDVVLDMSTMQDSSIVGLLLGAPSSLGSATTIKASGSFPATSPLIKHDPASVTEARNTLTDLFLDCDNIAQDGVLVDHYLGFRMRRVTVIDALRDGFRMGGTANSFTAELVECYSNGADTAAFHLMNPYIKMQRCVSDSGSSSAIGVLIGGTAGAREKVVDCHFAGGSIGIKIDSGGGRSYIAGNRITPDSNATKTVGIEITNVSSGILNRITGNIIQGNISATTSIGIDVQGNNGASQIIGGNHVTEFDTGIKLSGQNNALSNNWISAETEGITIASNGNSIMGGRIDVTTGPNAINVTSGTGNITGGVSTPDAIVGAISRFDKALVVNEDGDDIDSRIEGNTDANLFYTDAGNDRVGIGTDTPSVKFDARGSTQLSSAEGDVSNAPRWIFKQVDHTDMTAAATADTFTLWTLPANTMIHDIVGTVVTAWEAAVGLSAAVASVGTQAGAANDLTLDDNFFSAATVYELHDGTASGGKGALLFDSTDKFAPYMFVAGGVVELQMDLTGDDHADTNAGQARIYALVSQPLANTTIEAN